MQSISICQSDHPLNPGCNHHEESILQATAIFGNIAEVVHPAGGKFDLAGYDSPSDAIMAIITRHPMRQDELEQTLSDGRPNK